MEERRRYARIPVEAQIVYKIIPHVKIREYLTKDMSQGGIKFFVDSLVPKGSHLKVRITLPGSADSFEALVRIVWTKQLASYGGEKYEVGASFVDMPRNATERFIGRIKSFSDGI